ncbi:hypothetical protein BT96DRAFT_687444 [Gymnopus androsaceus JB14]|uniref:Uncharacterized protein n=1 Tax=Gymnopus androsaceus JB14 TaxID=1447944 RepID=A0A6A4HPF9_9AGAR|nr:hypothetical protein BT96DRAFT_687444 [Gymnopus androsaceus JB14]
METPSRDPNHPRPTHKRNSPSSPSYPSSRSALGKLHAHSRSSRSLDLQHTSAESSADVASSSSTPSSANSRPNKTSRIMSSVKRSLSVSHSAQKKQLPFEMAGMYSTSAERAVQNSTRFRRQDPSSPPPSVEQIAMGLHISRTPYLRSSSTHVAVPLPPPPSRSALKKPEKSSSSPPSLDPPSASSTATSSFPSTPQSNRSLLSFKTRMSRLLPGSQSSSSAPCSMVPSPVSSPRGSTSEFASPKKAVRFSSSALDLNNHKEEE